jgi:rhodanese-related sulfurtransferase
MRLQLRRGWLTAMMMMLGAAFPAASPAQSPTAIGSLQAFEMLKKDPGHTFLIDVRTRAEYQFAGHPVMAYNIPWRFLTTAFAVEDDRMGRGRKARITGYQLSPRPNPRFTAVVRSLFKTTDRLLLISARGRRSAAAAEALIQAGFQKVYDVADGYWGPGVDPGLAEDVRRLAVKYGAPGPGRVAGWVYWRLPLTHAIDPKYVYPPDLIRRR